MTDAGGFGGISLFELFKLEAEAHCAALSNGLLALEKSPNDRSVVEPLMRAAHSIKGAGRIIGLNIVVTLAHTMEERFLAAQSGKETLTSTRVDQLLRAVDVLAELSALSEPELAGWTQAQAGRIDALVAELSAPAPAASGPAPASATPAAPTETSPAPPPSSAPAPSAQAPPAPAPVAEVTPAAAAAAPAANAPAAASSLPAASVRVASSVLNKMLMLAGESTVEASRMQTQRALLAKLRARERTLDVAVQSLRTVLREGTVEAPQQDGGRRDQAKAMDVALAEVATAADELQGAIVEQAVSFEENFRRAEVLSGALYTEVLRSRMRPFSEGVTAFPRMVRDIARQLGKSVALRIDGESVEVDREILQKLESPLTHMIRNSLDHGVEPAADREAAGKPAQATITLTARHQSGMLLIEVRDDGRGINPEDIRRKVVERQMVDAATAAQLTRAELMEFPFLPGFSTKQAVTEISGRGVGLDVVQSMVRDVSGTVTLDSEPGRGTRFSMRLPVTRSVIRAALVRIGGQTFAVPLARLDRLALVPREAVQPVQGRLQFTLEGQSIGLIHASDMLGGEATSDDSDSRLALVIGMESGEGCGLIIDEVCGEEDLVARPLDTRLGTVAHIAAVAIRADGEPVFIVDVDDLRRSVKQALQHGRPLGVAHRSEAQTRQLKRRILVVDDSITVREVERQLLLRLGYDVDVAVDGKEGYNALRARRYDLLVTDVDMPRMTGIELIRALRREPRFADLPIIIVSYKDREEDRLMGMEAGASAYLTKSSFQDDSLTRMVQDLIGAPT